MDIARLGTKEVLQNVGKCWTENLKIISDETKYISFNQHQTTTIKTKDGEVSNLNMLKYLAAWGI